MASRTELLRSQKVITAVVWLLWAVMAALSIWFVHRYGRAMPFEDDYLLFEHISDAPMTWHWLWNTHNGHRIPLVKFVGVMMARATRFDARAGMYLNVVLMSLAAALPIITARRMRGGVSRLSDAAFPLTLLHFGHWFNFLMLIQMVVSFTIPSLCWILMYVVLQGWRKWYWGVALLLPFLVFYGVGGHGVVYYGAMPPVLLYMWLRRLMVKERRTAGDLVWFAGGVALYVASLAFYMYGYAPEVHEEAGESHPIFKITVQFIASALGPLAARVWPISGLLMVGFVAMVTWITVRRFLASVRSGNTEHQISAGLLGLLGSVLSTAAIFGVTRSGDGPEAGLHYRIYLSSAMSLVFGYFVFSASRNERLRNWGCRVVAIVALASAAYGNRAGLKDGRARAQGMDHVTRDLVRGYSMYETAMREYYAFFVVDKQGAYDFLHAMCTHRYGPFAYPPLNNCDCETTGTTGPRR